MKPGVYIRHPDLGTRFLASLDDMLLGSRGDQRDIADDIFRYISDAVELSVQADDESNTKFVIYIIQ